MLCLSEPEPLVPRIASVKLGKPKQDTRFDVPVFGLQTLQAMKDANIGNAALESGSVLLLDSVSSFEGISKFRYRHCWY